MATDPNDAPPPAAVSPAEAEPGEASSVVSQRAAAGARQRAGAAAEKVAAVQPDPIHEEVRLALGMNGGVSLAVWMGGVAVELDCARRAHLGPEPAAAGSGARSVYNSICTALCRSLVPDIVSGASAGGLNGALLAAVMRHGRALPANVLRESWLELGDFSKLLEPLSESAPRSLMQGGTSPDDGGVFYTGIMEIFEAILDPKNRLYDVPAGQAAAQLDAVLDVAMTDIAGEPRLFADVWGQQFAAREYRAPFRFRRLEDFTAENLATAARSSASFPVAFEPFLVAGDAARLAGFAGARYAIDGGLLENAPIDAAIRLIPGRPAASQVKRFVVYVNPEALSAAQNPAIPTRPSLISVLSDVVNIPRNARFVDQLYAVQTAQRRALFTGSAQPDLITTDWESLETTATALLPTYRRRRMLLALQEAVCENDQVKQEFDSVDAQGVALWPPASVAAPADASDWDWDIGAAERLLNLEVDLLRTGLTRPLDSPEEADELVAKRREVLEARTKVFASLARLAVLREASVNAARSMVSANLTGLEAVAAVENAFRADTYQAVTYATDAFVEVAQKGLLDDSTRSGRPAGAPGLSEVISAGAADSALSLTRWFIQRGLAIEVVQRAFSTQEDAETAQGLSFVQLAPFAPTLIFTETPFHEPGPNELWPDSGQNKLTGILLMRFSGFYRRSWRANDFMWGRLDGATRIVDLLIDGARAGQVLGLSRQAPAPALAAAVMSTPEGAKSATEALDDAIEPDSTIDDRVRVALQESAQGSVAERLEQAIAADLSQPDGGSFTRVICERAVQLEILAEELDVLDAETRVDAKLGAYMQPLDLPPGDLWTKVGTIRALYAEGESLPARLGRGDPRELNSDLALQTIARTAIVSLAALRSVNVTFGKAFGVFRALLLPVTGVTSRTFWDRLWTGVGFAAAATYIGARLASPAGGVSGAPATLSAVPLGSLWSPDVLLAWIGVLAIVGVAVVPWLRALRNTGASWQRLAQAAFAILLVALPLGVPVALAYWFGHQHFAQIVATRSAFQLPASLSLIVLGVVVAGAPILRLKVTGVVASLLQRMLTWLSLTWIIGLAAAPIAVWSTWHLGLVLRHHAFHWPFWVAATSLASAAACALYLWPWFGAFAQPKLRVVVRRLTTRTARSPA